MVQICEVESALAKAVADYIYPDSSGEVMTSAIGFDVKICRGWPQETELGNDLMASPGVGWITVNQKAGSTVDKTRYRRAWYSRENDTAFGLTLLSAKSGDTVTFQGVAAYEGVAGAVIDNIAYPVQVNSGDTAVLIAQKISAKINNIGHSDVSCSGATLSVNYPDTIYGRVGECVTVARELSRTEQGFNVSIFAPSIEMRDIMEQAVLAALLEAPLSDLDKREVGYLDFSGREIIDTNLNANLYRLDLTWKIEIAWTETMQSVPALWPVGIVNSDWAFGVGGTAIPAALPPVGAIRFDAWYDMTNSIDQQCATALDAPEWLYRLPGNAVLDSKGVASWPEASQQSIDQEISSAISCGLSFWAFDSYEQDNTLSLALSLYLSSNNKGSLRFCMIGQSSNWSDTDSEDGYADVLKRDINLMSRNEYMTVMNGRPLYFVLDASAEQLAGLPGGLSQAITFVRNAVSAATGQNPYIVYLSGAALADYDNTIAAQNVGADAAGAYCTPRLSGAPQPYSALVRAAENDWDGRSNTGFPMIPTAMTGWDQRPLVDRPQEFYPLSPALTDSNYYMQALAPDIATHIMNMTTFLQSSTESPASVGLIYAWNEFAEGGWLAPTYSQTGPDTTRVTTVGSAIKNATHESVFPDLPFIT
ncbi:glycoside hydrolase family 71/99 protein [Acetobacter fallax]|uniref:GTA TIM-barrel-like domain-containing protein n=1 Tax=Acetobacter fallax TaxID=1737473 RepID=A0ABX0KGG4_9PROT|nr:hypothetical protein [Acetobacter fallax]NHO34259.1 hypothetical protein [Acetobacter fallax]NHO37808.1 hypothetical protein [Acetobacter fallax]